MRIRHFRRVAITVGTFVTVAASGAAVAAAVQSPTTTGRPAAAARWALPPAAGVFDYQIGGAYRPERGVQIVDRDWHAQPAAGYYNVCYINAYQSQAAAAGWWKSHHRAELLRRNGQFVHDPGWPGEIVFDTSTPAKRAVLARVEGRWIASCATKGFDAVEPDNLDSWTRHGVDGALTRDDNLALAKLLIAKAHSDGLAIAQKNTVQVSAEGKKMGFDFAIAEECGVYHECAPYMKAYGKHVVEVEYTDNPLKYYRQACRTRSGELSILLRDRDVTPRGSKHYVYKHC